MGIIFKKLNLKNQTEILVINSPQRFECELSALKEIIIRTTIDDINDIYFSLIFVTTQNEIDTKTQEIIAKTRGDAILWFAYPKRTSKKYKCDITRDIGWNVLGNAGFEGVRQIAIDEDWSAIRFRRVEFIKTMIRDPKRASSLIGKKRAAGELR